MQKHTPGFEEIRCLDAPLADKLAVYVDHLADSQSDFSVVYTALVDRLVAANAGSQAPEIGNPHWQRGTYLRCMRSPKMGNIELLSFQCTTAMREFG